MIGGRHVAFLALLVASAPAGWAQDLSQRGFVEARATVFPQRAPNDSARAVADLLAREEVFAGLTGWLQASAGVELRANSHDQVEPSWRPDAGDRGLRRPAISVRRLSAIAARGPATIEIGKQFVRWGTTDIVTPTDRFAPRDFLDVVTAEFLAVLAARVVVSRGPDTLDAVWVPRFTPSRTPLVDQRWTVTPTVADLQLSTTAAAFPGRGQAGLRWSHIGTGYEFAVAFFDGFNHLPDFELVPGDSPREVVIAPRYPALRMYGGDAAVPTRWFTLKGEAAYFTTTTPGADEYVLYVVQLERQSGEWVFIGGYAGEAATRQAAGLTFAPDRGLTRSLVGRASYTIDTNRSVGFEAAARQNGRGAYVEVEYSQARGQHWRTTVNGVLIRGEAGDFLGQYRRNSHASVSLRYSF